MKELKSLFFKNSSYFLIIILLYNIIAKLWYINDIGIWYDEAFSLQRASLSFQEIIKICQSDTNPPLYLFLLKIWLNIFGFSIVKARILSVIIYLIALITAFFTLKKYYSTSSAYFTLILISLSNIHTEYAQEIRGFELVFLLVICSINAFHALHKNPNVKNAILLALCYTAIAYTHYVAILFCLAQVLIYFACKYFNKQNIKYFATSGLLALVAFMPWINFVSQVIHNQKQGFWLKKPGIAEYWNVLASLSHSRVAIILLLICSIVLPFIKNLDFERDKMKFYTLFFIFLFPYLMSILLSSVFPVFLPRYLLFTSFGIYSSIAFGIGLLSINHKLYSMLYGLLFILFIADTELYFPREENWAEAIREMNTQKTVRSIVIHFPSYRIMTFTLLYNQKYFFDFKNHKENLASENIYEIDNLDELKTLLTQKSFDKIIFFNNPESNEIDKYLKQNYIEQKLSTHRRIWQKTFVPKPQ